MPTKTDIDYKVALPSLTTLNLSHNQLSASKFSQSSIISLPPNLTNLDLSSNNLSGRIPLQLFGKLQKLKKLDLANNGLDDNFFICPSSQHATSTFEHLETLNLSRNALDSLEQLEFALRIPLERPVVYSGITSPFLVKAIAAVPPPSSSNYPTLRIDLTGNFLREELPRRKQLRRDRRQASASTAEKQSSTSTSTSDPDLTTNLVRLLDDVHCKLTRQLALRSMPTDDLERIRILLEELNSMIPGENQSAPTNTLQQTDDCTPAQMSRDAASHQTPSIVRPSIVNVSGSSRARRQRLEEQAKEWDPL